MKGFFPGQSKQEIVKIPKRIHMDTLISEQKMVSSVKNLKFESEL